LASFVWLVGAFDTKFGRKTKTRNPEKESSLLFAITRQKKQRAKQTKKQNILLAAFLNVKYFIKIFWN
jgi:hypothetical protein